MRFGRKSRRGVDDASLSRGANWATIVGVPIALVALALAYLALDDGGNGASGSAAVSPGLERIDLIARNELTAERPALEFLVHNGGSGRSVISRARIEILTVRSLPLCFTQGDLPTSQRYGAQLPAAAEDGEVVEVPLHQQLGPDRSDRFRIDLGVIADDADAPGVYLFELDVSLVHDGEADALPMGGTMVSLPNLPYRTVYYLEKGQLVELEQQYNGAGYYSTREMWDEVMPCWQENGRTLQEISSSRTTRSSQLEEAIRAATVPSYTEAES